MNQLQTIFDDLAYEITNSIKDSSQNARFKLHMQCRAVALHAINDNENYTNGAKEENEINQGLCLLVQITNSLIEFNAERYKGLLDIYKYLDHDMTDKIDKDKAKEVIRIVFNKK